MIIPDICNVLSTSGKEFSLSHWYSPIIDSWVTKIEVQRKHLFQIFRIYWIDSLFNMQVFWDLRMQWSNCPYFVAKKDLHWIYLVEKGKSGYSCQDAKFRSTPSINWITIIHRWVFDYFMFFQFGCSDSSVTAIITFMPYSFMHGHGVNFQSLLCLQLIVAFVTLVICAFFVFWLFVVR